MAGLGNWLKAVRDHPDRPSPTQCHALACLALRLDWTSGAGFASTAEIAADAGCDENTVRRATAWARAHGLLVRSRRGHRRGDGSVLASEWRTWPPSQPRSRERLRAASTAQPGGLNRAGEPSQPLTREHPSKSSPSKSSPSTHAGRREDDLRAVLAGRTDDEREVDWIIDWAKRNSRYDPITYLGKIIANDWLKLHAQAHRAVNGAANPREREAAEPVPLAEALVDAMPRPPWCGQCDERTRQVELDDDTAARCPRCHPASVRDRP